MKRYLHWFVLGAFLLVLLFDAVVWAGAARLPQIGEQLRTSARREAPLSFAYMGLGSPLLGIPILRDYGTHYALDAIGPLTAQVRDKPLLAMEIVHGEARNDRHRWMQHSHLAAPVLLVLWILTYLLRSRAVHFVPHRR